MSFIQKIKMWLVIFFISYTINARLPTSSPLNSALRLINNRQVCVKLPGPTAAAGGAFFGQ